VKKGNKIVNLVGSLLELILLIALVTLISLGFELIAEGRFGVEIPSPESMWIGTVSWSVIYFGIVIMLYTSASPKSKYTSFALVTIVIIEFIESCNIFFLKILPQITWAKTGDFLIFLAGVGMLSLFVLIVAFYEQIHKLFIFEEDEETEEVQEEDEEEEV
jgi:magnesium-transporting ATPase (P-type)